LIRCGVKGVIASTTNGAFDEFGVGVGDSSMIAVARKDADAVKVRGGDFVMWLFDGTKGFASSLDVIRS
jgi:hypothetical protein